MAFEPNEPRIPTLDPEQLRARQVAEEERKRFEKIAERVIKILKEEKVTMKEMPFVISLLTSKVNAKIDKAEINTILDL